MKKGLGKGLGALIPFEPDFEIEDEVNVEKVQNKTVDSVQKFVNDTSVLNAVQELKINDVEPNENQPRKYFNEEELQSLAESIREHGVIQPIIVTKNDDKYLIVTGERRWRASRLAGLKTIPAIVKELAGRKLMEVAIIENIQRQDLNPIEEAEAFQRLISDYELAQEDVAKSVGKSRTTVTNTMRLLNLDDRVKDMVVSGRISGGHAKALVSLNKEVQYIIAQDLEKKILNVRETEGYIKRFLEKASKEDTKILKTSRFHDIENDISEKLKELLGTKVQLKAEKDKGKIIIDYYSNEELERLLDLFYNASSKDTMLSMVSQAENFGVDVVNN